MSLEKIICVQDIGTLVNLKTCDFGSSPSKVLLLFGENGTGKSTFVDILRSLKLNRPEIINGRKALSKEGEGKKGANPKVKLKIDGKFFEFDGSQWSKRYSEFEIFDLAFIEANVYSGSEVNHTHYENQYEIIIGEKGIKLRDWIAKNSEKLKNLKKEERDKKFIIADIIKGFDNSIKVNNFIKLEKLNNIDKLIENKKNDLDIAKNHPKIKKIPKVSSLTIPIEVKEFMSALSRSLEDISLDFHEAVRNHITQHIDATKKPETSPENWLRAGFQFKKGKHCPFCAQDISDSDTIRAYSSYFSQAYKTLYNDVMSRKKMLEMYKTDEFKNRIDALLEFNRFIFGEYKNLASLNIPELPEQEVRDALGKIKELANLLDEKFNKKLEDLSKNIADDFTRDKIAKWNKAKKAIDEYNEKLQAYNQKVDDIKEQAKQERPKEIKEALNRLELRKLRFDSDMEKNVESFEEAKGKRKILEKKVTDTRDKLREDIKAIVEEFSNEMNEILKDCGANFKIEYGPISSKGFKATVKLFLVIEDEKIEMRSSENLGEPSLKNTLSEGDKSTLALAFFLANIKKENLPEKVIIMDDPFTSLDHVRRYATAGKIREVAKISKQVIVFSHDMHFLKIVLDKLDKNMGEHKGSVKCAKFPEIPSTSNAGVELKIFDLEAEIEQEERKAVRRIRNFVKGKEEDASNVAKSLRIILENFYRSQNPEIFSGKGLGDIVCCMEDNNSYTKYLTDKLRNLNEDLNKFHHGASSGAEMQGSKIELLRFCEDTIAIIEGNYQASP